jgi:hypothetical protein
MLYILTYTLSLSRKNRVKTVRRIEGCWRCRTKTRLFYIRSKAITEIKNEGKMKKPINAVAGAKYRRITNSCYRLHY